MNFISENIDELIRILVVIVALYSAISARRSVSISKKSLAIAEKNDSDKNEDMEGYLVDAERWLRSENLFFAMHVRFSNNSILDNSFKDLNICLSIVNNQLQKTIIKIPLNREALASIPNRWEAIPLAELPFNINGKGTFDGAFMAKISKEILNNNFIESVSLEAITLNNSVVIVNAYYVRDEYEEKGA